MLWALMTKITLHGQFREYTFCNNDVRGWYLVPVSALCLLGKSIEPIFNVEATIGWICYVWANMTATSSRVDLWLSTACE
jgi:hypothetical protein